MKSRGPAKKSFGKHKTLSKKKGTIRKGPRNLGMKYGDDLLIKPKSSRFGRARIPVSETFKKKTSAQKIVESLQNKKDRDARKLFLVEGEKSFLEVIQSTYQLHTMFATHAFLATYPELADFAVGKIQVVDAEELSQMGTLATNMSVIGIFHQKPLPPLVVADEIVLVVSDVNDPGNLGTLIRTADWYGISKIVCSRTTVDLYNPKVISATKGSFTRVLVYYTDLEDFFMSQSGLPVFAADLVGNSIHKIRFPKRGALLLGSESHGIDRVLEDFVTQKITIPRYGNAESLNVAIAGAIILNTWKDFLK